METKWKWCFTAIYCALCARLTAVSNNRTLKPVLAYQLRRFGRKMLHFVLKMFWLKFKNTHFLLTSLVWSNNFTLTVGAEQKFSACERWLKMHYYVAEMQLSTLESGGCGVFSCLASIQKSNILGGSSCKSSILAKIVSRKWSIFDRNCTFYTEKPVTMCYLQSQKLPCRSERNKLQQTINFHVFTNVF